MEDPMNRSTMILVSLVLTSGCAQLPDQANLPERDSLAFRATDGGAAVQGANTINGPVTLAAVTNTSAAPAPAAGTFASFLTLDGIEGASTVKGHIKDIDVLSYSWGVSQSGTTVGSGGGAGKAQFADFEITKVYDKASPVLMQHCATGKHIKTGTLRLYKLPATLPFAECTLSDVMLVGVNTDKDEASACRCTERVGMVFSKIVWKSNTLSPSGGLLGSISAGFDLKENTMALSPAIIGR
jgi:type VI secretion system secreted protein Hcp